MNHSGLIERLGEQAESLGIRSLRPEERHILIAVTGYGLICNGGFFWLYQGFTETELLVDAFESIGFPAAAQACRESMEAFPKGAPFLEIEAQAEWLDAQNEAEATFLDRWDTLSRVVDGIPEAVFDEHIEEYVRAHAHILSKN